MASMIKPIAPRQQSETRSAVERIGAFAAAARPEHLTTDIRQLFKRNILDSIGCAIAAVAGPSLRALCDQIEEYRAPGRCTFDWRRQDLARSGGTLQLRACALCGPSR